MLVVKCLSPWHLYYIRFIVTIVVIVIAAIFIHCLVFVAGTLADGWRTKLRLLFANMINWRGYHVWLLWCMYSEMWWIWSEWSARVIFLDLTDLGCLSCEIWHPSEPDHTAFRIATANTNTECDPLVTALISVVRNRTEPVSVIMN